MQQIFLFGLQCCFWSLCVRSAICGNKLEHFISSWIKMLPSYLNLYKHRIYYVLLIVIPLALSAFTHLWNPTGFPIVYIDESHYLRRALQVIDGQGPQESSEVYDHPYDHPYFGQIYLASLLALVGYPDYLNNPEEENMNTIQALYMIPRLIMGILAVIDTFFVYKIGEIRYGRNVGFIAAVLFAVMPLTWMFRMVLLDSLLITFLLLAIFLAIYHYTRNRRSDPPELDTNNKASSTTSKLILVGSGISLGLAIFTKVPIITMIPLVAYLVYNNTKSFKCVCFWAIPVILIPLLWPAYAISYRRF